MRLIDLFDQNILNALPKGAAEQKATGVTADSRQVSAGMIFVAIKGHTHDGHAFIQDAIKNGAVAVVSEEAVSTADALVIHVENSRLMLSQLAKAFTPGQPSIIAAVTGTNGKTSVADFLRQIWQQIGWRSASIGTLGVRGAHLDDVAGLSNLTTPDAIELHRSLNALSKAGVTNLAMEASSHGLEQNRLSSVFITAAGFTNLSRDHLDHHDSMDAYFDAKARLFTDHLPKGGGAVINIDDASGVKLVKRLKGREMNIITIGHDPKAMMRIESIHHFDGGMTMTVAHDDQRWTIPIALMGEFQAENALMAAALAYASGLSMTHALMALPYLKPAPGRMQTVHGHPKGAAVIVDYAHTPDALQTALVTLRSQTKGRLSVVFGCGGDRDQGKRTEMGAIAAKHSDRVIITDDNPRHEDPSAIRAAIHQAAPNAENIADRHSAIRLGLEELDQGDVLLIAGKGHENNQLIGSETLPFSDEAVVSAIISDMTADAEQGGAA